MQEMTTRQIWATLTLQEREDACLAFWQGTDSLSREAQPRVLRDLAAALRFREVFLKRTPPVEKARHLRRLVDSPALRQYADEVLRSWLLVRKNAILICFVEAQGMAHTGGLIDDQVAKPDVASLRKGIAAIRAQFPPRDVALYMSVMLAAGGEFWTGLKDAVEAEWPDYQNALGVTKTE
jgi:hypothetical protein